MNWGRAQISKLHGQEGGEGRQIQEQELDWVGDEVKLESCGGGGTAWMETRENGEEGELGIMKKRGGETVVICKQLPVSENLPSLGWEGESENDVN